MNDHDEQFDISCYADHELDYWNAALDHSGQENMTQEEAKNYCLTNGITPYLKP